jgi:putative ABC transport system permease protein
MFHAYFFSESKTTYSFPNNIDAPDRMLTLRTKLLFGQSRTFLRNALVAGQFVIAVTFIIGLLVFERQMHYIEQKDLGYSYTQVVKIPIDRQNSNRIEALRTDLKEISGVRDITYGYLDLGGKAGTFGVEYLAPNGETKHMAANLENVATNYMTFFNMKIVAGRDFMQFNPQNEYIINESMAKLIGNPDPVGKAINLSGNFLKGTIVGVVRDFNYGSLHNKIAPLLVSSISHISVWKKQLYVKIATDSIDSTLSQIRSTLRPFFHGNEVELQFLDEHFRQVYSADEEAGKVVSVIGGLAVMIACLGLLSMAAFVIVRRTKEIGIRKVLGASVTNIVGILSVQFIRLVAIAFLIAAPLAGWLMNGWLQGFAYRVGVSWWIFVAAAGLVAAIAFLTVSFVSIRAARANPVNSLRSE